MHGNTKERLQQQRRIRAPRGFTLVEVLLSLALMLLVMIVAYAGMMVLRNVTVAGRDEAEQAQLVRAIERKMTSDIRCVLFREPELVAAGSEESSAESASTDSEESAADDSGESATASTPESVGEDASAEESGTETTSSSTATGSTTSTPSDAYASQTAGLFGTATTLVLQVSKPRRATASAVDVMNNNLAWEGPVSAVSDLRSISYFLAVAGGGGLQGAVGNTAAGGSAMFATEQGAQGLARLDGDRLRIAQADATGAIDLLAQQAQVLAPEVTQLQFRYFDGTAWVAQWDSATAGALPRAVEVTLWIDVTADEADQSPLAEGLAADAKVSPEIYRFVVALPLADRTQGLTTF